ncbi:MAG: hypothetical protein LQ343_006221 [Gyalolechia ehrenbergii]|nr:MAG: hypothetical protein LQ343_006221 [Gyalolechia ehrenbergii]
MTDLLHTIPDFPTKLYTHLIPSLEKNLVTTTDLLTLEPLEVARRAQLPLLDVKRLTKHVLASLQSQLGLPNAKEALRNYEDHQPADQQVSILRQSGSAIAERWSAISTVDPNLDAILSGGIATGYITEVTGESGAGKTQFLLSLLLTAQLPPAHGGLSRPTVYISTEHPLPTTRLSQILRTHPKLSALPPEQKPSLSRIFSIQTPDLESQDHILTYQVPVLLARHKVGLIILDSITANYRAERSSTSTSGAALGLRSSQLIKLGHHLRTLAREHNCAIVASNQVADRFSPLSPPPPPQRHLIGSSPPPSSTSSPSSAASQGMMPSLDAALIPPPAPNPPPTHSYPHQPPLSSSPYPPLTLDHQQNFFTGWSSGPLPSSSSSSSTRPSQQVNQNLKTPALGLVWTNQLACRIALIKEHALSLPAVETEGGGEESGGENTSKLWRRYMKVVFAAWGPSTGVMDKGTEFEIWGGGMRSVVGKG